MVFEGNLIQSKYISLDLIQHNHITWTCAETYYVNGFNVSLPLLLTTVFIYEYEVYKKLLITHSLNDHYTPHLGEEEFSQPA